MSDKINVIARKIYEEGLEKAQKESEALLIRTQSEAEEIIKQAKEKAEQILKDAEVKAEKERKIINSEIKLASEQMLEILKQKIKHLISFHLLDDPKHKGFEDPEFLKQIIVEIASNWDLKSGIEIKLSESIGNKIEEGLKASLSSTIKNLQIRIDEKVEKGFIIHDLSDHFEIAFTDDQFKEFLKPFIKEKTHQILFANP